MSHRPLPDTWVRLMHKGSAAGKWHRVTGWHADRVMLGCATRDRHITWALKSRGEYRVERTSSVPTADVCRHCRPVDPTILPARLWERVAA